MDFNCSDFMLGSSYSHLTLTPFSEIIMTPYRIGCFIGSKNRKKKTLTDPKHDDSNN